MKKGELAQLRNQVQAQVWAHAAVVQELERKLTEALDANRRLADPTVSAEARRYQSHQAKLIEQYRVNWAIAFGQGYFEPLYPKEVAELLELLESKNETCPVCLGKNHTHYMQARLRQPSIANNDLNCRLIQTINSARHAIPYFNREGL